MMRYPVNLQDDEGTVLVTFPDFPEAITFGEDEEDALLRAVDALETAIQGRITDREAIPAPGKGKRSVRLSTQATMKVLVYQGMRDAGLSKAALARHLSWNRPQVDRLLDLRHATRTDLIDQALDRLGMNLVVSAKSKHPAP